MSRLAGLILAGGKGTRMKSKRAKVLHPLCGKPMVQYPLDAARGAGCGALFVVVGHQQDQITDVLWEQDVTFIEQQEQLGSGHAVAVAEEALHGAGGDVLIVCGDVPLITPETLRQFVAHHCKTDAAATVLTVYVDDPFGYGRIVRDAEGRCVSIVEERDADSQQKSINEINSGIYCCKESFLFDAVKRIRPDNDQGEYYLPDIVAIGVSEGRRVEAYVTEDAREVRGINDRAGLAETERIMRERILAEHMRNGVTIVDPASTYIDHGVVIGSDTVVFPNALIRKATTIGTDCIIGINCTLTDATIGNNVHIKSSCVIEQATLHNGTTVGPFAHLRPETVLDENTKVGNFVEVKKSRIGRGSKASHLTYIGDATIGADVNIGAGTITCNYDGRNKHRTVIKDGVFVGSNTALVAPVTLGVRSVIGAGSTITKNVPDKGLSVARGRQKNYDNYFRIDPGPDNDGK